jgi:hypothetical protein
MITVLPSLEVVPVAQPVDRTSPMKHDSAPRIDPVLNLARNQMQRVANIHRIHLAIVSGKDETRVVEFDQSSVERMLNEALPALINEIGALGVIHSAPTEIDGRYGATITLIDRLLEVFYVPIVRLTNADTLVGDFRPVSLRNPQRYDRIYAGLSLNWLAHGED